MLPDARTLALALWAPMLAGTIATAITWLVWYYTAVPCTLDNASVLMCRPGVLSRFISATALHHCVLHASIAVTIVGGSDIMLFLRERHRNNQMMDIMKTALEEAAEERRRAAEERREAAERAAEERRAFLEALNKLTDAISQNERDRQ